MLPDILILAKESKLGDPELILRAKRLELAPAADREQ
jgi:hypothetical protein